MKRCAILRECCAGNHNKIATMSGPNKNFFSRVQPWLERIAGAVLLFAGIQIIRAGDFKTRRLEFHGTMAYVAGAVVLLLSFLLLRGHIYGKRAPHNWTRLDIIAGVLMALGLFACIAVLLYQFFTGHK